MWTVVAPFFNPSSMWYHWYVGLFMCNKAVWFVNQLDMFSLVVHIEKFTKSLFISLVFRYDFTTWEYCGESEFILWWAPSSSPVSHDLWLRYFRICQKSPRSGPCMEKKLSHTGCKISHSTCGWPHNMIHELWYIYTNIWSFWIAVNDSKSLGQHRLVSLSKAPIFIYKRCRIWESS